jgi:hypothetical protein
MVGRKAASAPQSKGSRTAKRTGNTTERRTETRTENNREKAAIASFGGGCINRAIGANGEKSMKPESEKEHQSPTEKKPVDPGLTDEQANALDQMQPDYVPGGDDEKKKEPPKNAQSVAMITMVLGGVFEVLAVRLGDHWRLDPKEAKAIAEPAVAVLDKYLPDFESGPELALVASLGMVVLPRALQQKQIAQQTENDKETVNDGNQPKSDAA